MKTAFFPMARTTFYMESAEENFQKSGKLLSKVFPGIRIPEKLLTETADVAAFAAQAGEPDLVIYQCSTFIGAEFIYELTRKFNCPIIIWSVREPSIDGGRLKLNSLTGAFSAANSVYVQGRMYDFVFGNPDEEAVAAKFASLYAAMNLILNMKQLVVGVVGSQPAGFGFGSINETEAAGKLGVRFVGTEAAAIMNKAKGYAAGEYDDALKEIRERTLGANQVPAENLDKYARLRKAFGDFVRENGISAIASRCWPDFFTGFGAPVCAVLSMLNENGVAASCETDIGGTLTMYIASQLSHDAVYFGDPVAVDEKCDAIVYWHCGAGAACLANPKTGAKLGVHPNRKIGPTMEFGLKAGQVTVLRLGHDAQGYRMFLYKGEALDEAQKFWGTSVTVRPEGGKAAKHIESFVADGWEPHFVVAYGDITEEIKLVCKFLKIRVVEY